ncbi:MULTISPECIES: large conductance mechanosensitive channel protein MscL [Roseiflexus]|jgi:large conductance mechanosensitive channel|uniref:Large-conductance mechanosensitive channel n=1 Tax=Roseiflexus castenholzii (strain DSM 13941 / HLO8) TaxID=383372 RepID=A7NNP7_ROSCS|nr:MULTISPECIES: large conductance mechanosensitive channel protein MscL [Roseiflexus]ABU59191.1 large conductance mechanosensitive channel protein [Roseiflexus castenholzii DSM 13941]GIW02249.1 MAG: large-conductance mechanosensitive channel [Roseiflexus sp.]
MFEGFRKFVMRGNVVDLAVGVVIGTAFSAVVNSLVNDVLLAAIATLVGKPDFSGVLVFGAVRIGAFLTAVVNFLLIAAAVYFFVVTPVNKLNDLIRKPEPPAPPEPSTQEKLLIEIRDLLRQNITRS